MDRFGVQVGFVNTLAQAFLGIKRYIGTLDDTGINHVMIIYKKKK